MAYELQDPRSSANPHLKVLFPQIVASRRRYSSFDQEQFYKYLSENIDAICEELNTRWLISICDTVADFKPTDVRASNALLLVTWANTVKLWATSEISLMEDPEKAPRMRPYVKQNHHLWDGVITYDLFGGDMVINLLTRINQVMAATPELQKIYQTMRARMKTDGCPMHRLMQNHKNKRIL